MKSVLTIAGSDSLAGGGLQADLKTFEEYNLFGVSALTSVAVVNPQGVAITSLAPDLVASQLESILTQVPLAAAKTGLLGTTSILRRVSQQLRQTPVARLVIDPVLVFKEGATSTQAEYITALKTALLPLGTVVTPNLEEAALLSGQSLQRAADLPGAAAKIQALGCPNVVIKGGNRLAGEQAVDYLLTPDGERWFRAPKVARNTVDGAGCTFSAAITAGLARGQSVSVAVQHAKDFVHAGIASGVQLNTQFGSVWQGAWRQKMGEI